MGRKEFYERLEELNMIRKNLLGIENTENKIQQEHILLEKINKEISHLKLLHQI
jgi:adenine C2-methylase RlmN of 23S rRNA A2503 and tRNA A37